jgi:hypothetical protein
VLVALFAVLAWQQPSDSTAAMYRRWCGACHGATGDGVPAATTKLEVEPTPLADCRTSSAEPEDLWIDIVRRGGAAFGLSLDMPAYEDAATPAQITALVRYVKGLCTERGWPPGELNFPRAFLTEKAFPENEWVVEFHGDEQELIYERRFGRRLQLEGVARTATDGEPNALTSVSAAVKYNAWHSLRARALASVGLEVTPPLGRRDTWELEPFLAAGASPGGAFLLQGGVVAALEEGEGLAGMSYRLGVGKELGRVVPMLEAGWEAPADGEATLALYPQLWIQLSRLGHVAASVGLQVPAAGPGPRSSTLTFFVLWDFGDGGLFRGW